MQGTIQFGLFGRSFLPEGTQKLQDPAAVLPFLGGKPGRIIAELEIRPPRPRERDFALTAEFAEYKREILSLLGK